MSRFSRIRDLLQSQRAQAISALKADQPEVLATKLEIDDALRCLAWCEQHGFSSEDEVRFVPMSCGGGYYDLHLLADNESPDPKYWTEVIVDGEPFDIYSGDYVVRKAEKRRRR